MRPSLVWFRHDLRLADNPALSAAVARGGPVIPVYIWSPQEEGEAAPGAASRWWLHHSLASLDTDLRARGSGLVVRRGAAGATLRTLVGETGAAAVFWNRRYEPQTLSRDADIKNALRAGGVLVETFNSGLLFEPWALTTGTGKPFQVFTPFWKAALAGKPPLGPIAAPPGLPASSVWPASLALDALGLLPAYDWTGGIRAAWTPGEHAASASLDRFLHDLAVGYADDRNRPDLSGTSRLSPHLHFGEIGPRQVFAAARAQTARDPACAAGIDAYLREIGWREFAHHVLFHFPRTTTEPLRREFAEFPWARNDRAQRAWRRGGTGYPLVDAGMRELWHTGWMHNRVRMVAASFLVKHLRVPWQDGAAWFWDTLVDADLANNTLGWQWTAGCGADAAPFFRIFNPVTQGDRFDPDGTFVRRWVPELAGLPTGWIHKPWAAPEPVRAAAGVVLDRTYPAPIVDHAKARATALTAFAAIRRGASNASVT
ncbi:DNA photolyase family protein [Candidatus Binatia bacterium]|nr:DNA photolyase family protein [Candidatus Binatia bacterium]